MGTSGSLLPLRERTVRMNIKCLFLSIVCALGVVSSFILSIYGLVYMVICQSHVLVALLAIVVVVLIAPGFYRKFTLNSKLATRRNK